MKFYYSTNKNVQFLIALLKKHGIKRIIASPGTTNLELIGSMQHDGFFEMYSCVDERSAAYLACGLAAETNEPVVISCTEATASRNFFSGLTEAYHRKLKIMAVTGMHKYNLIGNLEPQVIDRSVSPNDAFRLKVNLPLIKDKEDEWESVLKINSAILELYRRGGGPVHINLPWGEKPEFSVQSLPEVNVIERYYYNDKMPDITQKKIIILVGSHNKWSNKQTELVDLFCKTYNALVLCDHTSRYYGKYRVQGALLAAQSRTFDIFQEVDLLIHIGEEFGDDLTRKALKNVKEVWRISPDGELRDTFRKLKKVFEMEEESFFEFYTDKKNEALENSFLQEYRRVYDVVRNNLVDLPFSSIYVALKMSSVLPPNSVIHFGLSDTIRAWNFFELPDGVTSRCNAGCRGIDGCVSALIGSSLSNREKLFFGVFGDLTFFYDMNVLGNRHIGNNVRILVVNNDGGNIFRHNGHCSQVWLGYENTNMYIAAGGHFGKKSKTFVKHYSEDLGFEYLAASNKQEFEKNLPRFVAKEMFDRPIFFEIFTSSKDDSDAFDLMSNLYLDSKGKLKSTVKSILGKQGTEFVKKITRE